MGLLKESLFQRIVDVEKKSEMRSSSIWPSGETCRHNPGVLAWLGWHCLGPNEMGLEFVTGAGKHKLILALRSNFGSSHTSQILGFSGFSSRIDCKKLVVTSWWAKWGHFTKAPGTKLRPEEVQDLAAALTGAAALVLELFFPLSSKEIIENLEDLWVFPGDFWKLLYENNIPHAQVTPQQQQEIFEPAPAGVRKIVLTTNIAEVNSMTCGEGGQNAWSEGLVGFSLVQYWWFAKSFSRETLARFSWKSINHWRQDVIFLANFLGGCLLLGLTTPVWEFSGFHHCGGHGICDRLGKSQRGELWSISQGRNFDHFLDLQGAGGFDGKFVSMILIFLGGKFLGVVEGGICLKTNSYKLLTCFWMYRWLFLHEQNTKKGFEESNFGVTGKQLAVSFPTVVWFSERSVRGIGQAASWSCRHLFLLAMLPRNCSITGS